MEPFDDNLAYVLPTLALTQAEFCRHTIPEATASTWERDVEIVRVLGAKSWLETSGIVTHISGGTSSGSHETVVLNDTFWDDIDSASEALLQSLPESEAQVVDAALTAVHQSRAYPKGSRGYATAQGSYLSAIEALDRRVDLTTVTNWLPGQYGLGALLAIEAFRAQTPIDTER